MTALIDKEAFRRFAPKELYPHLRQFDERLLRLCAERPSVKLMIENPYGRFSLSESKPVIHLVALERAGHWVYIASPADAYQRRKDDQLRVVKEDRSTDVDRAQPRLLIEVVTDPALTKVIEPAIQKDIAEAMRIGRDINEVLGSSMETGAATSKPAVLLTVPLALILRKTAGKYAQQRFCMYQHIFGGPHEYPDNGLFYIGITSREWKQRWAEHRAAIQRGSPLKFHRQFRERSESRMLTYVHHQIMGVAESLDRIQDLEEVFVAGHWQDTRLLNMIPGGKAGIAYLHEHGVLGRNVVPTPDTVERVLEQWVRDHPRKGLPAPWIAEMWKDDAYAMTIICGAEGRLSIEQVRMIRRLADEDVSTSEILTQSGAKNLLQVQRVVAGQTYRRVRSLEDASDA